MEIKDTSWQQMHFSYETRCTARNFTRQIIQITRTKVKAKTQESTKSVTSTIDTSDRNHLIPKLVVLNRPPSRSAHYIYELYILHPLQPADSVRSDREDLWVYDSEWVCRLWDWADTSLLDVTSNGVDSRASPFFPRE